MALSQQKGPPWWAGWNAHTLKFHRWLAHGIWWIDPKELGRWRGFLVRRVRVVLLTIQGFNRDHGFLQSAALTYATVFALGPLLAVAFALAKGFGADEALQESIVDPFLDRTFGEVPRETPDGAAETGAAQVRELTNQLFEYIQQTDFTKLGVIAFLFLLYSAFKLLSTIEGSINSVWGVQQSRSITRRITNYITLLVVTPIVLVTASTATASLQNQRYEFIFGGPQFSLQPLLALLPLLAVCLGMSYLFVSIPNTRVNLRSGLTAGLIAGILWQLLQYGYVQLQVGVSRLNAIYSSFAAFPLFLMWLYFSWIVFLLGAHLAFAHQNEPIYTKIARTGTIDQKLRETLGLRIAGRVAAAFLRGEPAPTTSQLASELGVAPRAVAAILARLEEQRLVACEGEDRGEGHLPARDPARITVLDLLQALRQESATTIAPIKGPIDAEVDRVLRGFDAELDASDLNLSLEELAMQEPEGETAAEPEAPAGEGRRKRRRAGSSSA